MFKVYADVKNDQVEPVAVKKKENKKKHSRGLHWKSQGAAENVASRGAVGGGKGKPSVGAKPGPRGQSRARQQRNSAAGRNAGHPKNQAAQTGVRDESQSAVHEQLAVVRRPAGSKEKKGAETDQARATQQPVAPEPERALSEPTAAAANAENHGQSSGGRAASPLRPLSVAAARTPEFQPLSFRGSQAGAASAPRVHRRVYCHEQLRYLGATHAAGAAAPSHGFSSAGAGAAHGPWCICAAVAGAVSAVVPGHQGLISPKPMHYAASSALVSAAAGIVGRSGNDPLRPASPAAVHLSASCGSLGGSRPGSPHTPSSSSAAASGGGSRPASPARPVSPTDVVVVNGVPFGRTVWNRRLRQLNAVRSTDYYKACLENPAIRLPREPNPAQNCSKRQWEGQVLKWRKILMRRGTAATTATDDAADETEIIMTSKVDDDSITLILNQKQL